MILFPLVKFFYRGIYGLCVYNTSLSMEIMYKYHLLVVSIGNHVFQVSASISMFSTNLNVCPLTRQVSFLAFILSKCS